MLGSLAWLPWSPAIGWPRARRPRAGSPQRLWLDALDPSPSRRRPPTWRSCAASRPSAAVCRAIRSRALPTPVQPLEHAGAARAASAPLWIKRDDVCGPLYGGNKPRKLEWLLGAALARGRRGVITFGGIGTHHGLATAICARDAGLRDGAGAAAAARDRARAALPAARSRRSAPSCTSPDRSRGVAATALRALRARACCAADPLAIIPTGGTSARGALGYVNAACELAEQVRAGRAARAGRDLRAGRQRRHRRRPRARPAASPDCAARVVGVLVTDILPPSPRRLARLARGALRRLRRAAPQLPAVAITRARLRPRARVSRPRLWRRHDRAATPRSGCSPRTRGLALETTYTAKCLAALLDLAARPPYRGRPLLFWNTFSSVDLERRAAGAARLARAAAAVPPLLHLRIPADRERSGRHRRCAWRLADERPAPGLLV